MWGEEKEKGVLLCGVERGRDGRGTFLVVFWMRLSIVFFCLFVWLVLVGEIDLYVVIKIGFFTRGSPFVPFPAVSYRGW